jgi:Arc/MetJ family transcription regulator
VVQRRLSLEIAADRCEIWGMRAHLTLDDDQLAQARELTGVGEISALVREALKALIERESARRLALLRGSQPQLADMPRRRPG